MPACRFPVPLHISGHHCKILIGKIFIHHPAPYLRRCKADFIHRMTDTVEPDMLRFIRPGFKPPETEQIFFHKLQIPVCRPVRCFQQNIIVKLRMDFHTHFF